MKSQATKIVIWILDLVVNVAIIFALVLIIQTWIVAPFDVSGASMCNTLNYLDDGCHNGYGEKIIINEATYLISEPQRGDIVVFKPTAESEKYFIKRIIGLPGETVEIRSGKVFITTADGTTTELEENYLNEDNRDNTQAFFGDLTVFEIPNNHYFMMGDNRKASTDSRSCFKSVISSECRDNPEQAYVHIDDIRGKAWLVWWPLSSIRHLDNQLYSESLEEK